MPDDKTSEDHTFPPPPMDPFPTYQTPYPRSNQDDDQNPFIQFRRFADEQFSSLFSGFPHFFGLAPSSSGGADHWKKEVEDIMRHRQEWEEGFRKQFEQEMEEMRQQMEKSKTEAWKSMEDAWKQHSNHNDEDEAAAATPSATPSATPWWTRGNAAKCPALNGQEPQKNALKCPALYDENGQPRTELDAYNALQPEEDKQVQVFQAPAQDTSKKSTRSWFSPLGWDGQQKERLSRNASSTQDTQTKSERPVGRPTTYSLWAARRMQPFDNPDETIPWLMLSPYSPIYLCNPGQSRLFKVKVQDSEGVPLQISQARFFERWYTDVDEKMATQKPWADAFEDLLSLQQTGKMVERDNWNTWRTPRTWIHDMASRGSLGDRWGFDDEGMLVKRANATTITPEPQAPGKEDRCARWRKNRGCRRNKSVEPEPAEPAELAAEEKLIDKATDALAPFPLFGSIVSAADAIVSAIDQAAQNESQVQAESSASGSTAPNTEHTTTSSSSYSTSSSASYDYNSSTSSNADSVVSTLTTTVTRTLPNGSVETKRVLKRRFADGSEESDESVEVKNPTSNNVAYSIPFSAATSAGSVDKETQTQYQPETQQVHELEGSRPQPKFPRKVPIVSMDEPEVHEAEKQPQREAEISPQADQQPGNRRRGGGWFWN